MKKLFLIIVFIFVFTVPAHAAEIDETIENFGIDEITDSLDEDTQKLLDSAYDGFSFENIGDPENLISAILCTVNQSSEKPLGALLILIGIIVAVAVAGELNINKSMTPTMDFIVSLMMSAVLIVPIASFIERIRSVIENTQIFIAAYAPVYAAVTVSSGSPASAASYCTTTVVASEISAYVITKLLLPLIGVFAAIALVAGMSDVFRLEKLAAAAEKLIKTGIGIVSTIFIGILSVRTIIASCGDSVAFRSAKYVVSGFVPVAGGILGESLTAVFSCMKYIKGTVGAFGIIAGGFIFLPVIVQCVMWQLCVGVAGYAADIFEIKSACGILKSIGSVLGMVMYLLLFEIMLLIVTTAAVLISGGV